MIIRKKFSKYTIYFVLLLIILDVSYALPYIYMTDDWDADEGTITDEGIFVDKKHTKDLYNCIT